MKDSRINRVLSMLIDHIVMSIVIVPIIILIFFIGIDFGELHYNKIGAILMFFPSFIYLNKDFFKSRSVAKRLLGYQVINRKTNLPASEFQCFIRNLTIIAWPIEGIIGLINPERRIGDFLANTKVIKSEKERVTSMWNDIKSVKLKLNYIGIIIVGIIYFYLLSVFMFPEFF